MHWIFDYSLVLFDLDGLLVDTEQLHYLAYRNMLGSRGFTLNWDFPTYFQIAQQDAGAPQRAIYKEFPELYQMEPSWDVLYKEKKEAYRKLLEENSAPLLPGVEPLLLLLKEHNIERCVVTHTARALVDVIREKNPLLNTIPNWFCREDYENPKPSPDGYMKAISTLSNGSGKCVGFEDSFRGMQSLMATTATPVFVNSLDASLRTHFQNLGIRSFQSMTDL